MLCCIVICGGGGKTTLFQKNPDKYLDIDYYMWKTPSIKFKLESYVKENNIAKIGELYQYVMLNDTQLIEDTRIILVHRPINAEWLQRKVLLIVRPKLEIHLTNIASRNENLQKMAIMDWNCLTQYDPIEYWDYSELEEIIEKEYQKHIKNLIH